MPADFNKCVKDGGKVRTKKLKGNKYLHVCFLNGKSYAGEVKTKASEMILYPVDANMEFDELGVTKEIQVLPVGVWNHPVYGKIEINENDINKFIKNFDSKIRKELPITEGHSVGEEEKPAIGWFKQLINKGRNGLWAIVEWTKEGMELLNKKAYKYFSPEFYTNYEDPESREEYQNVLVGGALTNRPYFKGLQAVVLSELILNKMLTLKEILEKVPEDLTDEEVKFVKENKEKLNEEELKTFASVLGEGEPVVEPEVKEEPKVEPEVAPVEEPKPSVEPEVLSETMINVSKTSMEFLEKQAQEGMKAIATLRKTECENFIKGLTFSETNKKANFLPKSQNKIADFMLSLSEAQQEAFKSIVAELPQAEMFSEIGKDSAKEVNAKEMVADLTKQKMDKNAKLSYRQAIEQVFAENPELQNSVLKNK
jgi:hypothetical protein